MEDRPPLTLRDALIHRRLLVVAIVAAFLLGGAALSLRPRTYEAGATIYLDTTRTAPGFDVGIATSELLQHDFILMATSRAVLERACASATLSCPADLAALAKRVHAAVYRGTSTVIVLAKAATAADAAAIANAVAQAVIDQDRAEVARLFKPAKDSLDKELADLGAAIASEQQQLQRSPTGSPSAAAHQAQLTRLENDYSTTFTRLQNLVQDQAHLTNVATIGEPAVPPARPASPNPPKYLLAALVAGLVVAGLAALLVERFDDRIFTAESLARAAGVPVALVTLRRSRRGSAPSDRPYAVALATVLARLPDARTVLVAAASDRDHSDTVAAGLGAVAAHAGQQVVVVRADGHPSRPRDERQEVPGLTTITAPPDNGQATAAAVADAWKRADGQAANTFVLVSVPSPDTSPTALLLSRTTRRAVLAATAGATRFQDAQRTAALLRNSGVEVVAAILLNGRPPNAAG